ncbi:DNA polymerase [Sphingomonas sp. Leaf357]|uniref:UdgX family uracil-DNA binding protein n=1 Tax=Sphingomonas sp. Leaf357 TaxID=1736350 RepID=UPI0006F47083|nr:UdgX family uracil-DNA binding protein [Sphingomonas sp. Leaf357]KQS02138.1 DNA polymerase [Sphingomonas sp. Leaf357]
MRTIHLAEPDDFDGWRDAARALAAESVPPEDVVWQVGDAAADLFADPGDTPAAPPGATFSVPRAFVDLARKAVLHSAPERFALLYTALFRLRREPKLIEDHADPLVRQLEGLAREVRRDIHKMRAFLRFREVDDGESGADTGRFVAWFEPDHHIVRANAAFFIDRFAALRWSILTPELSIHWDTKRLEEGPGAVKSDAPDGDPIEDVWKTYYASIFNPARLKVGAMLKEMPRKYWKNMPETALVSGLIAGARARESGMIDVARTQIGGNIDAAWAALRDEAAGCTRCSLHQHATQTVFGEGPTDARLMFVGEQPGDQEDLAGRPFVGPAGQVFDRAIAEAGIDRAQVYVTNAVKHFKFEQRGKRRIHAKPGAGEITACRWWVDQERMLIKPQVTVALGATAARSLLGRVVTIGKERGRALELPDGGGEAWITVHPSFLLRLPDEVARAEEYARFVEDLRVAAGRVTG